MDSGFGTLHPTPYTPCTLHTLNTTPPWRQPMGKTIVSLVNSHANATSKRWHLWEIDLKFALELPSGWSSPY